MCILNECTYNTNLVEYIKQFIILQIIMHAKRIVFDWIQCSASFVQFALYVPPRVPARP